MMKSFFLIKKCLYKISAYKIIFKKKNKAETYLITTQNHHKFF